MANQQIAELISARLITGLTHPGDPEKGQKATNIGLPIFRTAGMVPEVKKQVDLTAKLIGEAIVYLIEHDGQCEIVPKADVGRLRTAVARTDPDGPWTRIMGVHCQCDKSFTDPLMQITVTDAPHIVISGRQLLTGLSKRDTECPHRLQS